uniref:Putative secreted protein n=1 Tax=Ixodes ricinus TaxID=34613 RepID=A0A6B0UE83_IXORI
MSTAFLPFSFLRLIYIYLYIDIVYALNNTEPMSQVRNVNALDHPQIVHNSSACGRCCKNSFVGSSYLQRHKYLQRYTRTAEGALIEESCRKDIS